MTLLEAVLMAIVLVMFVVLIAAFLYTQYYFPWKYYRENHNRLIVLIKHDAAEKYLNRSRWWKLWK